MFTVSEKVKVILKRKSMTIGDLAEKMGLSRQNLSNKLSRNNFSESDINSIANALNYQVEINFIDNATGEKI